MEDCEFEKEIQAKVDKINYDMIDFVEFCNKNNLKIDIKTDSGIASDNLNPTYYPISVIRTKRFKRINFK